MKGLVSMLRGIFKGKVIRLVVLLGLILSFSTWGGADEKIKTGHIFHQYLFGLVVFESGSAKVVKAPDGSVGKPLVPGTRIKIGMTIQTFPDSPAEIRLGCGSLIRLAPNTRLTIQPFGITLEEGSCLARHGSEVFPLKIQGASTLLVTNNSLVELERRNDTFLARVQYGSLRSPELNSPVMAGQSIMASGKNVHLADIGPEPLSWANPPSGIPNSPTEGHSPPDTTIPTSGDTVSPNPTSIDDSPSSPASQQTSGTPDTGDSASSPQGNSSLAEDWMKQDSPP